MTAAPSWMRHFAITELWLAVVNTQPARLSLSLSCRLHSPDDAGLQPGLAGRLRLSGGGQWAQLHPVGGRGQQRPPCRAPARRPSAGDRGAERLLAGEGCTGDPGQGPEEHPPQHRRGVPNSAGEQAGCQGICVYMRLQPEKGFLLKAGSVVLSLYFCVQAVIQVEKRLPQTAPT